MALEDKSLKERDSMTAQLYNCLSHDEIASENLTTGGMMLGSLVRRHRTTGPYYRNSSFSTYYDNDYG